MDIQISISSYLPMVNHVQEYLNYQRNMQPFRRYPLRTILFNMNIHQLVSHDRGIPPFHYLGDGVRKGHDVRQLFRSGGYSGSELAYPFIDQFRMLFPRRPIDRQP